MNTLFLITVLGCSHDLSICDAVDTMEIAAANMSACEVRAQELVVETPVDYPTSTYSCKQVDSIMTEEGAPTLLSQRDVQPGKRPMVE